MRLICFGFSRCVISLEKNHYLVSSFTSFEIHFSSFRGSVGQDLQRTAA